MRMELQAQQQLHQQSASTDQGSGGGSAGRPPLPTPTNGNQLVLAVECVAGSSTADEWDEDMVQTGDIVEELKIGTSLSGPVLEAPFKNGRSGIQKQLATAFKRGETSAVVTVRREGRDGDPVRLHACIVPYAEGGIGRKQYVLRSIHDPNYAVCFVDRTESQCALMQGSKSSRVASALSKAQLQDGYVAYPWEKKMRESLPIPGSSCFLSLIILPKASDATNSKYNNLEDTLARANAWLNSSQATGVPIVFMNVQAEALLTKISGDTASATVSAGSLTADLSNLANASLYGFEDYHGVDIGVVRAVRLWYTPVAGEYPLEIKIFQGDTKLGFSVSRTEEGFLYISAVEDDDDAPSGRSGVRDLYREALASSKKLVISRVSNEKVLPWMVSPSGAIRCFDTVSLSQKLSLHRHALRPILIHVLMWDRAPRALSSIPPAVGTALARPVQRPLAMTSPEMLMRNLSFADMPEGEGLHRDAVGEASFRFGEYPAGPNSWA